MDHRIQRNITAFIVEMQGGNVHQVAALHVKIKVLKKLEVLTYQMAYYILDDVDLAMKAAEMTLLALGEDEPFFLQSEQVQRDRMKQIMIRQSVVVMRDCLSYRR